MSCNVVRKMKCRDIAEYFRRKIRSQHLKPGTLLLSAPQITRKFNCCLATANHALDLLEEEELIIREKGRGNFVRENLVHGRKLILGLADELNQETDPYRKILLEVFPENVLRYLRKHSCNYRLIPYLMFKEKDRDGFKELDGLLISLSYLDSCSISFLRSLDIPIVIYRGEYEMDLPYPQIVPNFQPAAEQLFQLARSENFREILIIHAEHRNGMARCAAFLKEAEKNGYPKEKVRSVICDSDDAGNIDKNELKNIAGKLIISCSDLITYDLIQALNEFGFHCGADYQIVGVDNLEEALNIPAGRCPRVTAIDYSRIDAARTAAGLLISLAARKKMGCYQIIKFPTRLTLRDSAFSEHSGVFRS